MQRLDEDYCSTVRGLLNRMFKFNLGIGRVQPEGVKNIGLAGSTAEGAALARIFRRNDLFPKCLNREIELDIEYVLLEIPENMKSYVEDLQGKKIGFLNLRVDSYFLESVHRLGWNIKDEEIVSLLPKFAPYGYLLPYRLKEISLDKLRFCNSNQTIEVIFAYVLNKKVLDITFTNIEQGINKSSVKFDGIVNIENRPWVAISFDTVHLIKLTWWPEIASEWKTRKRNWPDNENLIKDLTKESFIITKPTCDEDSIFDSKEMRYSFSHVERKLVGMRSRFQNMTYLIFKCMIYKWLSPTNTEHKGIKSFLGKTVMFWICEANHKDDKTFWKEDYQSLLIILRHLFEKLLTYFETGFMPYYFIPEINVIQSISVEVKKETIQKIQSILQNIEDHLPGLSEIEEWSFEMIHFTKSFLEAVVEAENRNWASIFLRNPNIVLQYMEHFINLFRLEHQGDSIREMIRTFQEQQEHINQVVNFFKLLQVQK